MARENGGEWKRASFAQKRRRRPRKESSGSVCLHRLGRTTRAVSRRGYDSGGGARRAAAAAKTNDRWRGATGRVLVKLLCEVHPSAGRARRGRPVGDGDRGGQVGPVGRTVALDAPARPCARSAENVGASASSSAQRANDRAACVARSRCLRAGSAPSRREEPHSEAPGRPAYATRTLPAG